MLHTMQGPIHQVTKKDHTTARVDCAAGLREVPKAIQ